MFNDLCKADWDLLTPSDGPSLLSSLSDWATLYKTRTGYNECRDAVARLAALPALMVSS